MHRKYCFYQSDDNKLFCRPNSKKHIKKKCSIWWRTYGNISVLRNTCKPTSKGGGGKEQAGKPGT